MDTPSADSAAPPAKPPGSLVPSLIAACVLVAIGTRGVGEIGRWMLQPVSPWSPDPALASSDPPMLVFVVLAGALVLARTLWSAVRGPMSGTARALRLLLVAVPVLSAIVRSEVEPRLDTHFRQALAGVTAGMPRGDVEKLLVAASAAAARGATGGFGPGAAPFPRECFNVHDGPLGPTNVAPRDCRYVRVITLGPDAACRYVLKCDFGDDDKLRAAEYRKITKDADMPSADKDEVLWTLPKLR